MNHKFSLAKVDSSYYRLKDQSDPVSDLFKVQVYYYKSTFLSFYDIFYQCQKLERDFNTFRHFCVINALMILLNPALDKNIPDIFNIK